MSVWGEKGYLRKQTVSEFSHQGVHLFRLAKNCAEIYSFSKLPEIVSETVNVPILGSLKQ